MVAHRDIVANNGDQGLHLLTLSEALRTHTKTSTMGGQGLYAECVRVLSYSYIPCAYRHCDVQVPVLAQRQPLQDLRRRHRRQVPGQRHRWGAPDQRQAERLQEQEQPEVRPEVQT